MKKFLLSIFLFFPGLCFSQYLSPNTVYFSFGPCGGIDSTTVYINNTGIDTLNVSVQPLLENISPINILLFNFSGNTSTFNNILNFIITYIPLNNRQTVATLTGDIEKLLSDKDLVIFCFANGNFYKDSLGNISTQLQNFVARGGKVIFIGTDDKETITNSTLLNDTNNVLLNWNTPLPILQPSHPFFTDITSNNILSVSNTYAADFADTGFVTLAHYNNQTIVGYKNIGKGVVIYSAFNFSNLSSDITYLFRNMIRWANSSWSIIPDVNVSIPPGTSQGIKVYCYSLYTTRTGTFYKRYSFNYGTSADTLECVMNIDSRPCARAGVVFTNCSRVHLTNLTTHTATSYSIDMGDGTTFTGFPNNIYNNYHDTGAYQISVIACNNFGCDTFIDTIYIQVLAPAYPADYPFDGPQLTYGLFHFEFNSIDNYTGANRYEDFTCTYQTSVVLGQPYYMKMTTDSVNLGKMYVFLDKNDNGEFEIEELIYEHMGFFEHEDSIAIAGIPDSLIYKPLRLRVALACDPGLPFYMYNPHGNYDLDVEDYTVFVSRNMGIPPKAKCVYFYSCSGLEVQFRSTCYGDPDSIRWKFNDGTSSTELLPLHTFPSVDSQSVTLIAYNAYGIDSTTIWLDNPFKPAIHFTAPIISQEPDTFWTNDYPGAYWWYWSFPEIPESFNTETAIHTYQSTGNYLMSLSILWWYIAYSTTYDIRICDGYSTNTIDVITGVNNPALSEDQLSIYPNPFYESTQVTYNSFMNGPFTLHIFDEKNSLVYSEENISGYNLFKKNIFLPHPGIYYLTIRKGEQVLVKKLVSVN